MTRDLVLLVSSGLLIFASELSAATPDNTLALLDAEDIYIEELPVIISATRLEQPLNEAPVATTIIDRQMIDASGAQTIADLLRLVPGFTVGYLNGNYQVATYHGQSDRFSKRVQLLIDGRSVYQPTLAGVSWSDLVITIDEIDRIEVIRGPNASTYGNNAFQAVISIITKHASEDQGQLAKVTVGSHDTLDALYRFGGSSDNLDYRVSVRTKNNDGTDLLDDFTETNAFNYRLDYQLNTSTSIFYQGGLQDSVYGDVQENALDGDNDVDITTAFQHIKLEHSFDNENSLSVQYYYNLTKDFKSELHGIVSLADLSVGTPFESILSNVDDFAVTETTDLKSERHDLEVNYYYNLLDSLRLISGASVRADKITAKNVFDPDTDDTLFLYRLFTHGEYRITPDWLLNAGVMLETNDISGTDVAPRLAIIHHLNEFHSMRLSVSRATRTPTIFDENGNVAFQQQLTENGGQPASPQLENLLGSDTLTDAIVYTSGNVQSEEITSYELGWMSQLLSNKLTIDTKIFYDKSKKLISDTDYPGSIPGENIGILDPESAGAIDFANVANTTTYGIEISANYQLSQDWRIYGFYAHTEIDAEETTANTTGAQSGRLEESVAANSFASILMKQWQNNLNTSLALYYVSDMDWMDRTHGRQLNKGNEFKDRSAEAYTRIDFILRKSIITDNGKINYSFILQNLAGDYYDYTRTSYTDASRQTVNVPGSKQDPRAYFELSYSFN